MDEKIKPYEIINQTDKYISIKFYETNEIKKYKIITNDDIKYMINVGEDINLENCYVNDFSYKSICDITPDMRSQEIATTRKILKHFNASQAFFDGYTDFSYAKFSDGTVIFSDAKFGNGDVNFSQSEFGLGDVYFKNTDFGNGFVNFGATIFGDGHIYFSDTMFNNGDVNFSFSIFGTGNAYFYGANFGNGNVDFSMVDFGVGDVVFSDANFANGDVCFHFTDFKDNKVFFWGASFRNGNVIFSEAKFGSGEVVFSNAKFDSGDIIFYKTKFGRGNVHFDNIFIGAGCFYFVDVKETTQFYFDNIYAPQTLFIFFNCFFSSPLFFDIECVRYLIFGDCTNNNLLSFSSVNASSEDKHIAFFHFTNMGYINFDWDKNLEALKNFNPNSLPIEYFNRKPNERLESQKLFYTSDYEMTKNRFKLLLSDRLNIHKMDELKADEFCMLKENYHNQGKYDWEDEAYVEFKKLSLKYLNKKNPYNIIKYLIQKILYPIGKFGTDPISIFIAMILTVFIFGCLYCLPFIDIQPDNIIIHTEENVLRPENINIQINNKANPQFTINYELNNAKYQIKNEGLQLNNPNYSWWSPFYYSIVTFFTIGYGDLSAQNLPAAFLCGIEGFCGVFLMAYFSVSIVRKILR